MNTIILDARVRTQLVRRSMMHIGNFSMVIALILIFPVRAQVPGGGEEAERLKQKALALMDEGRVKEAAATFREALKSAPRDLETLNDLGVALRKTGDFAGSLEALQAAVSLRPSDARIQSNLAVTLQAMGRPNQAAAAMKRACDLAPADFVLRRNLRIVLDNPKNVPGIAGLR